MMAFNRAAHEERKARFCARKEELGFVGALKSEEGAIDLASIMVGVIVIGVIAGVIAATVFAVIPWAQDKGAEQALDAVNQAESVAYAQSADAGQAKYFSESDTQLKDNLQVSATDGVAVTAKKDSTGYVAVSVSATGHIFSINDKNPATKVTYNSGVQADDIAAFNTANPDFTLTISAGNVPTLAAN